MLHALLRRLGERKRLVAAVAATLAAVVGLDLLFPPDLTRTRDLSILVVARNGAVLQPFLAADDRWRLPADPGAVDPRYLTLLKAYEDRRFDQHWGVDPFAVLRAAGQNLGAGRVVSGASTLTMQVARLMTPAARGPLAKIGQALRAVQLEARYSKDKILRFYLALAPFGGNLEGVRAASLAYFGKEPTRLTLAEAALLVALPQSPERQRPDRHPAAAKAGRDKVIGLLAARGVIGAHEAREAMTEPVPHARLAMPRHAPHLAQRLAARAAPGAVIRTEIDIGLQTALEALAAREQRFQGDDMNGAMIVVETASRAVRAYVANADIGGAGGYVDLAKAVRSPGSTLKPFIYAMAFDDLAAHPATLIEDRPTLFGDYAPRNFDRGYQGTVTLADALRYSLNVPAVALLDRIGPARFAARLSNAGVRLVFPRGIDGPSLPLALGGVGITLSDLVTLYAALGDGGQVKPLAFTTDRPYADHGARLVEPFAAWYVREALLDSPLPEGFGAAPGLVRRPIAFKTGTSYGYRDAWSIGVSGRYTVGVWVGRPDGSTRPGAVGRNTAAPLLLNAFDLLPPEPALRPPPPASAIVLAHGEPLPRALERFAVHRTAGTGARAPARPLEIAFPPDGATVALPDDPARPALALRAAGGRGTLHWVIDGTPLGADSVSGQRASWTPDGPGFARVTVIDSDGASATATVRLVASR